MPTEIDYFANLKTRSLRSSANSYSEISTGCNLKMGTLRDDLRVGPMAFGPETLNAIGHTESFCEVANGAGAEDSGFGGCDLRVPCQGTFGGHGHLLVLDQGNALEDS